MTTMAIPACHCLSLVALQQRCSYMVVKLSLGRINEEKNYCSEVTSFFQNLQMQLEMEYLFLFHSFVRQGKFCSMNCEVRIKGLETLDYLDCLLQRERFTEQADAITFDGEVHRVYLSSPPQIAIIDHGKKRTFVLRKEGLQDTVLWNPWDQVSKALPDFSMEDYKIMMLVDSTTFEKPIVLKPHQEWKCCQEIAAVSLSYCSGQLDPQNVLYELT